VQPAGIVATDWPGVRDTCRNLGIGFDGWQDGMGRLALATRSDGLYAADTSVISLCRQAGKTYWAGGVKFGLSLRNPGLTSIWTAHHFKTARETFAAMKALAARPLVAPHIARVSSSHGEEAIYFRNGSRILFGARENGFGIGFADVGVLVLDEAQRLTTRAMDDLIPTMNTAANPLLIMMGTPPRPTDPGEVFAMVRQDALDGDSEDTLYVEFSADQGADLDDRDQLRKANPSYPFRTSERAIRRMRKSLTEDSFRREALGIWDAVGIHQPAIRMSVWRNCFDVAPDGVRPDGFGVDMSHAGDISIAASWRVGDVVHAEEVWAGPSGVEAVSWLASRPANRRIPIVVDSASPAGALVPELKAMRLNVIVTHAADMAKACGLVTNLVAAGLVTHAAQESVTEALAGARKRPIRDAGGWGWDRRDSTVNIAPLVAWTLAMYGASTRRRRSTGEGRKVVVLT
jgi:hypothetical protein